MAQADVVIKGGTVVDGSGADGFTADVSIRDGKIAEIGQNLAGDEIIDADGCVVAPGFIDIHTHYDAQVTWDPWLDPSSGLGVTSVVGANCGYSIAPCSPEMRSLMMRTLEATEDMSLKTLEAGIPWTFETYGQYRQSLRARGVGINFGTYVGHTAIRLWAMGEDAYEREATSEEIDRMRRAVVQSIKEGALGFSTNRNGALRGDGGRPVPSIVASEEETETLCMAVAEANRGVVSVAAGNNPAFVYRLAEKLGRTITWNSILAFAASNKQNMNWEEKLACHIEGSTRTPDVHPQVTCRELVFTFSMLNPISFYSYPSFAEIPRSDVGERERRFRDAAWRDGARQELDNRSHAWVQMTIAESRQEGVAGRKITDVASERGKHPLDAMLDIALADDLTTMFSVVGANSDVSAVSTLLTSAGCVLGLSDAGAHVSQICDAVLPLDFLANWVRDRSIMSQEAGIRKVTGELADVMGFAGRGYLRPGGGADVVVLDWADLAIGAIERVRDLPGNGERLVAPNAQGIRHVFVNGTPTRIDGKLARSQELSGELLSPKRYAASPAA
jgi:N-acyl-D-amino-acid deacylase